MCKKRILVVDDEKHIVRLIQINLERAGYEVLTAYDGVDGLDLAKAERPDLVVLDVMMPRMDGFEVLKNIQQDPELKDMPVVLLTAKQVAECPHCGGRPFNPRELVAFIARIFESSAESGNVEPGMEPDVVHEL